MAEPGKTKEQATVAPPETVTAAPKGPAKALPEPVKQALEEGHQQLAEMRANLGLPKKTPFGPAPEEVAAEPAKPEVAQSQPQNPATTLSPTGVPTKEELGKMSTGALFGKLMESFSKISSLWKKGSEKITQQVEQATKKVNDRFSEEDLQKIAIDLARDKEKKYPSQDKSVEFVCTVLGLPIKETPQLLLDSFKNSGLVFETDQGKLKDAQTGDVIFFQKEAKKGEPYLTAVISSTTPLKVKMIPRNGGVAEEIALEESDYYKIEWMGFVKLPRAKKPTEMQAPQTEAQAQPAQLP